MPQIISSIKHEFKPDSGIDTAFFFWPPNRECVRVRIVISHLFTPASLLSGNFGTSDGSSGLPY